MNEYTIAKKAFNNFGEVVKKSDFISVGLTDQEIYSLFKRKYIERVKKGYYRLSTSGEPKEETVLSKLMSPGIISVESALFYYGYTDFTTREWTITVPRSYSRTVKALQKILPIKAYYVQGNLYSLGKKTGIFNDETLPVYDRERTICDCFKYRTKLDNEIFNKALNAYVADEKVSALPTTFLPRRIFKAIRKI